MGKGSRTHIGLPSPKESFGHRFKKVYADHAYKVDLGDWPDTLFSGIELEISAKPPSLKGFSFGL